MSIAEKLQTVAENQQKVYDTGYDKGHSDFWDVYQDRGNRTNYTNAFGGRGWTDATFKPRYDIILAGHNTNLFNASGITDLEKILNSCGVVLDTSAASAINYAFSNSSTLTVIPEISFAGFKNSATVISLCSGSKSLHTIRKLIIPDTLIFKTCFDNCTSLKNIIVTGTISTSINFQWSPLSPESMKSIISCLFDFGGSNAAYSRTITFSLDSWAALEADSTSPNGVTWKEYVADLGWLT